VAAGRQQGTLEDVDLELAEEAERKRGQQMSYLSLHNASPLTAAMDLFALEVAQH